MIAYTMLLLVLLIGYILHKVDGWSERAERERGFVERRPAARGPTSLNIPEEEERAVLQ